MPNYEELRGQIQAAKVEMKRLAPDLLRERAQQIFEQHSDLDSFGWTQYTPYFNDGDACVFGVNSSYPFLNGEEQWYKATAPATVAVSDLLQDFDEDDLLRDGRVETEEFEHD